MCAMPVKEIPAKITDRRSNHRDVDERNVNQNAETPAVAFVEGASGKK